MTFDSIQTIESAQQVLVEIVRDHLKTFPHRRGVLVAVLGAELSNRGLRGIHHKFGSEKLASFVRDRCQPPLQIFRAPNGSDYLVGLADDAPRLRSTITSGSWATVEPRVWKAVLSDRAPNTFIGPDRRVEVGATAATDGWKQVSFMPQSEQGALLDQVRTNLAGLGGNEEVRNAIVSTLEKAKAANAPILEFSNTMTALYRTCQDWNRRRIEAVFRHVAESTGIDLRTHEVPRHLNQPGPVEQERQVSESQPLERTVAVPTPSQGDDAAELRKMVKEAVDVMNLHDLLELRLPIGSIHFALSRRAGRTAK